MRPYIKNPGTKIKKLLNEFKGLYTSLGESSCPDGYSPFMKNISAEGYPAIKSREGRVVVGQFSEEICYIGVLEGKYLCAVLKDGTLYYLSDSGEWEYAEKLKNSTTGRYDLIYFINTNIFISGTTYSDGRSITYAINFTDGEAVSTRELKIPLSDFIDTVGGRVAVAYSGNSKIYLSGIMDREKWFDIDDGLETYMITQNCENISAIKTYGDRLICFKPHAFGELYGNTPDTYTLIMASEQIGCIEAKTICDCGKLLWLSDEGICSYGGGATPKIISEPVKYYIDNLDRERISTACAGYVGERYIISLPQKGGGKINLVLNLKTGVFTAEDDTDFRYFTTMGGALYGATADGRVLKLFCDSESVQWEWHSPVYKMDIEKKMNLHRIYIDGAAEGTVTLSVINDKGMKTEKTLNLTEQNISGRERFFVNFHPKDFSGCQSFQIVLKGEGRCEIENISLMLRKKNITYGGK